MSVLDRYLVKVSVFKRLSAMQWRWLFEAYFRLYLVQLRIKLQSSKWLRSKLTGPTEQVGLDSIAELKPLFTKAKLMHESVRLAARCHFWPTDCLPRSIVLMDMLNESRVVAQLKIGVYKKSDAIASHAWVEIAGQMVAEPESVSQQFNAIISKK